MEQMEHMINFRNVGAALGYSTLGLMILALAFVTFDRFTPGKLWKEIIEEHNIALAIIVGAVTLAVAHIISAAIHG